MDPFSEQFGSSGLQLSVIGLVLACLTGGCRSPISHSELIERYKAASCIPVSQDDSPVHTRVWKTALTLTDRSKVMVVGTQSPGGRIDIDYLDQGRSVVAANAGDYIYPSDVRVNRQRNLLYVKAAGLGGGIWEETWLFEYGIGDQKSLGRQKVAPSALPTECPATRSSE